MTLINLTPHPLTFTLQVDGIILEVPPTGEVARVEEIATASRAVEIDGHSIEVATVTTGPIHGLPEPQDGVIYIVSRPVAAAAKRSDVVAPDNFVRDEAGRIVAAQSLVTFGGESYES